MRRRAFLKGVGALFAPSLALARSEQDRPISPAALSVGISTYLESPNLPSAARDAGLVASAFVRLGFQTDLVLDPTQDAFLNALARWRIRAKQSKIAVVYIAAHGIMTSGQSWVLPSDVKLSDIPSFRKAIPEATLVRAVSEEPRHKVLFLDTCREIPRSLQSTHTNHFPQASLAAGTHISYAAQPNAPALDGENGHSPFAEALHDGLSQPGLSVEDLARFVRLSVLRATGGQQIPWERSSLLMPLVLNQP